MRTAHLPTIRVSVATTRCTGGGGGVLFPPTETDPCTEGFPDSYIVLCRNFSAGTDLDSDPCTETFPDGYCTHFRDGDPSQ